MIIKKNRLRFKVLILLFSFSFNIGTPIIGNSSVGRLKSGGQLSFSVSPKKDIDSNDLKVDSSLLDALRTSVDIDLLSSSIEQKRKEKKISEIKKPVAPVKPVEAQEKRPIVAMPEDSKPLDKNKNKVKLSEDKIVFNFEDVDLVNVAAYIESLYNVKFITDEIIKPISKGAKALSGSKVSFKTQVPMTKDQAWSLFVAFLNMAGFALVPQAEVVDGIKFYRIKVIKAAKRSAIPVYINVDSEKLPDNDQLIRYGYFIKDCPLPTIQNVLNSLRSTNSELLMLHDHNAFIITDNAYNIKVLMKIVKELDKVTMPQSMSVLKLYKVDAKEVKKIYQKLISDGSDSPVAARLFGPKGPSKALYFPKKAKMIVEERTNSLVLLGTAEAIKKIETFVRDYIDIDVTAPYSPLHIYDLKYADAVSVANIMNNLVKFGSKNKGGLRGGDKYFKNMSFTAEKEGNRLIIRGDYDDYLKVRDVIVQIDEPPVQVAIEILILAIDVEDKRELGTQVRNKFLSPDGSRLNFQTSGITLGASPQKIVPNTTEGTKGALRLLGDLISLVSGATAGNTVLSLGSDRYGVWGIFGILNQLTNTQIVANPFLTATNNTSARVKLGATQRIVSDIVVGSGNPQEGFTDYDAFIDVTVKPHINSGGMIVLDVLVKFDSFSGSTSKNTRLIETTVVSANNEVLALGGLLKNKSEDGLSRVPVLGKIPILGWFFKNKKKVNQKQDLLVLITPHIIDQNEGIKDFTKRHVKEYKDTLQEFEVVKNSKDPIDRSFFKDTKSEFDLDSFLFTRDKKDSLFKKKVKTVSKAKKRRKKRRKKKPFVRLRTIGIKKKKQDKKETSSSSAPVASKPNESNGLKENKEELKKETSSSNTLMVAQLLKKLDEPEKKKKLNKRKRKSRKVT